MADEPRAQGPLKPTRAAPEKPGPQSKMDVSAERPLSQPARPPTLNFDVDFPGSDQVDADERDGGTHSTLQGELSKQTRRRRRQSHSSPLLQRRSCVLHPVPDNATPRERQFSIGHGEQVLFDVIQSKYRSGALKPTHSRSNSNESNELSQAASEPDFLSPIPKHRGSSATPSTAAMMSTMLDMQKSSHMLRTAELAWSDPPATILVIKKPGDADVDAAYIKILKFLLRTQPQVVINLQEADFVALSKFAAPELAQEVGSRIVGWKQPDISEIPEAHSTFLSEQDIIPSVDLVITLGGDGTLLYAASLFQLMVPPVLAFALGSLGFLTPFDVADYEKHITAALTSSSIVTLRTRLECDIVHAKPTRGVDESPPVPTITAADALLAPGASCVNEFITNVLNEAVIDRGPGSHLSKLDIYVDGRKITTVQGDGLIIATPTGSTAYSVSAGGSMVHPTVPCILVTPICPHSLSFRPIILPSTCELLVCIAAGSRGCAWISMDGKNRRELKADHALRITTSVFPVPTLNSLGNQNDDWFNSISRCLNWNLREMQKPV